MSQNELPHSESHGVFNYLVYRGGQQAALSRGTTRRLRGAGINSSGRVERSTDDDGDDEESDEEEGRERLGFDRLRLVRFRHYSM